MSYVYSPSGLSNVYSPFGDQFACKLMQGITPLAVWIPGEALSLYFVYGERQYLSEKLSFATQRITCSLMNMTSSNITHAYTHTMIVHAYCATVKEFIFRRASRWTYLNSKSKE